jgi:enoyl-CoA hydratase
MARELIYTGRMIDAEEAWRIGLVNAVYSPDALMEGAMKTAKTICEMGPLAVTAAKRVIHEGEGEPLAHGNALEVTAFAGCFKTEDQREGMEAFLEKRSADFRAR